MHVDASKEQLHQLIEKMDGDLDYSLIRNDKTKLSDKEWKYIYHDGLVVVSEVFRDGELIHKVAEIEKHCHDCYKLGGSFVEELIDHPRQNDCRREIEEAGHSRKQIGTLDHAKHQDQRTEDTYHNKGILFTTGICEESFSENKRNETRCEIDQHAQHAQLLIKEHLFRFHVDIHGVGVFKDAAQGFVVCQHGTNHDRTQDPGPFSPGLFNHEGQDRKQNSKNNHS